MRRLVIANETYNLDEDCRWHGAKPMVDVLNSAVDVALYDRSPADGDPVVIVFEHAIEHFQPSSWIDDSPVRFSEPGVVY
jgi:hypothetical protein